MTLLKTREPIISENLQGQKKMIGDKTFLGVHMQKNLKFFCIIEILVEA